MKQRKLIFIILWLVFLLFAPLIAYQEIRPFLGLFHSKLMLVIVYLQKTAGLLAFFMVFVQIVLGGLLDSLKKKLGNWVLNFHKTEGIIAYGFVLTHVFLFFLFRYFNTGKIDPFYVFTDFCILCNNSVEFYYTLGRFAFWFVSAAVLAAIFRNISSFKKNWKYFHYLNYPVFFLVAGHLWFLDKYIRTSNFIWVFIPIISVGFLLTFYKLIQFLKRID